MRNHIIVAIFLTGLFTCSGNAHMHADQPGQFVAVGGGESATPLTLDLREPVYLVPDESFFAGCDSRYSIDEMTCRQSRINTVEVAVESWQKRLPVSSSNISVVVVEDAPALLHNRLVHLSVRANGCSEVHLPATLTLLACYKRYGEIVFLSVENITLKVTAHELGHAFGLDHFGDNIVNSNCQKPIMSEPIGSDRVTTVDVNELCRLHPELACGYREETLYDGFYHAMECEQRRDALVSPLRLVWVPRKPE